MHWLLFLIVLFPFTAQAELSSNFATDFPIEQYKSQSAKGVTKIINGTTLLLSNGDIVKLNGIEIPDQFARENQPSPYHKAALALLRENFEGKNIRVFTPRKQQKPPTNRNGQILGQIMLAQNNNIWAQKSLLEKGLARAWPSIHTKDIFSLLLQFENNARESKIGIWADPSYAIMPHDKVKANAYNMQIIEGVVHSIASIKNTIYLNFGNNWRDDFTVSIDSKLRKLFSKQGRNPMNWQGKKIRIRGYVEHYNGAMIKLRYIEQIEEQIEKQIEKQIEVLD